MHLNLPESDNKGLVSGMIDLMHKELHAFHLTPGLVCSRSLRHAFFEALDAAIRLLLFHGFHHFSHLEHVLIVAFQLFGNSLRDIRHGW